jgi:glycosyltransferase involved in cell wall biosynthesis
MAPTTTAIVCTHQGAAWVAEQLDSVLDQSHPVDEVVVADDGSTDATLDIVRTWLAGHPRAQILTGRVGGTTANVSRAIEAATGDVLLLADQDDRWYPHKVEALVAAMAPAEVAMACSDADVVDADGQPLGTTLWARLGLTARRRRRLNGADGLAQLLRWNVVTGATVAIRAEVARAALPLPGDGVHDWSLALVAAACGRLALVEEPLLAYRIHDANQVGLPPRSAAALVRRRLGDAEVRGVEHAQLVAVAERLSAIGADEAARQVRARAAFTRRRDELGPLPGRAAAVGADLARGRYRRYARGTRSAARDLVAGGRRPPVVLHTVDRWGLPSERFVRDLVGAATRTRPVVVTGEVAGADFADVHRIRIPPVPAALADRALVLALAASMLRHRPALVHSHFLRWSAHAERAARLTRTRWMLSLHGHDLLVEAGQADLVPMLRRARAVVVPSDFLADAAIRAGIDPTRVHVIPSGIRLDELAFRTRVAPTDGPPLVVFVGRFVEKKGVLDAVDALAGVAAQTPVRGRFVGYGPLEDDLRSRIGAAGLEAEVLDGRNRSTVLQAYADAHVVLTPSRTGTDGDAETLCIVNLEAQASGIPVVTTLHGGIPSGVTAASAVLVPEADPEALRAALRDLLADPDRWAGMGRAGRRLVEEHFVLADRAAEVEELQLSVIADLAAGRRRGRG